MANYDLSVAIGRFANLDAETLRALLTGPSPLLIRSRGFVFELVERTLTICVCHCERSTTLGGPGE